MPSNNAVAIRKKSDHLSLQTLSQISELDVKDSSIMCEGVCIAKLHICQISRFGHRWPVSSYDIYNPHLKKKKKFHSVLIVR